ncbi:MAG: tetratricopeptide repeat protein [Synechococcaceae cyanobacterium]|nr:tetratricopeptide repeat protein [Synechococcaceae cyanobacterium]
MNRANVYWLADCVREALELYQEALQINPGDALAYRGLANVLVDLGRFEAADRAYQASLCLRNDPETSWNRSQLLIGLERFGEGYALAEQRWQLPGVEIWRPPSGPLSREELAAGEPLLVWSEQGLGDTLQHLRWLGTLQALRGAGASPLTVEVEPCLVALLQEALSELEPQVEVWAKGDDGPEPWAGQHVSLLSLPWLLGGAPTPANGCWLGAAHWPGPREAPIHAPRIGLVWSAGRKLEQPVSAREYWRRSLDGEALGALIEGLVGRGVACWLLQFGEDRELAAPWRGLVAGELAAEADFAATAEVVASLDLVISVDTAMAHLVGAMRRPVWVLLPCGAAPRWGNAGGSTAWYPTMELFRQQLPGQWESAIDAVLARLGEWLEEGEMRAERS